MRGISEVESAENGLMPLATAPVGVDGKGKQCHLQPTWLTEPGEELGTEDGDLVLAGRGKVQQEEGRQVFLEAQVPELKVALARLDKEAGAGEEIGGE
jgi:hypothetical protein